MVLIWIRVGTWENVFNLILSGNFSLGEKALLTFLKWFCTVTPMGSLTFSEERMGNGVRGRWREWKQGLICKMLKDFFKKMNKKNKF